MTKQLHAVLAATFLLAACEGPAGPAGPRGAEGAKGDKGERGDEGVVEPGPGQHAPRILEVVPSSGSARSLVTLLGSGFGDAPEVWFDGAQAEVLHATATELVVRPGATEVREERVVQVTVITGEKASNAVSWRALPSRWIEPAGPRMLSMPGPLAISPDGSRAWVADARTGDLFQIDLAERRTTWTGLQLPEVLALAADPDGNRLHVAFVTGSSGDRHAVGTLHLASERFSVDLYHATRPQQLAALDDGVVVGFAGGGLVRYEGGRAAASAVVPSAQGHFVGLAKAGAALYAAMDDGTVYRWIEGQAPVRLDLQGAVPLVGIAAVGESLLGFGRDEYLIDLGTLEVSRQNRTWLSLPGAAVREPGGTWLLPRVEGVVRIGETAELVSMHLYSYGLAQATDGAFWVSDAYCAVTNPLVQGVARIDGEGVQVAFPDVCAMSPQALADGRMLLFDAANGGRLIAVDQAAGVATVLAEEVGPGMGLAVGERYAWLLKEDQTIDRYDFESGELETGWARTLDVPTSAIERGNKLIVRSYLGFEVVDLAAGGDSSLLWRHYDPLDNMGGLVRDADGRVFFPTRAGVEELLDDRSEPLFAMPPERLVRTHVLAVLPQPSGDLLISAQGELLRVVP